MGEIVWQPTGKRTRIQAFMDSLHIFSLDDLQIRAASNPGWFWAAVEKDLGIHWYTPYTQALDVSAGVPWARWFTGGDGRRPPGRGQAGRGLHADLLGLRRTGHRRPAQ